MRHRVVIIRLVALLVLVTSACDYCAFDLWDQTAPISLSRSEAIRVLIPDRQTSVQNVSSELPDDQCLWLRSIDIASAAFQFIGLPWKRRRFALSKLLFRLGDRFIPRRPPRA